MEVLYNHLSWNCGDIENVNSYNSLLNNFPKGTIEITRVNEGNALVSKLVKIGETAHETVPLWKKKKIEPPL